MREIGWLGIAAALALAGCSTNDSQFDEAPDADAQTQPPEEHDSTAVAFFVGGERVEAEPADQDSSRLRVRVPAAHQAFVQAAAPRLLAQLKHRELAPDSVAVATVQALLAAVAAADLAVEVTVSEVSDVLGVEAGASAGHHMVTFAVTNSLVGAPPEQLTLRFAHETHRSQDVAALPAAGEHYLLLLGHNGSELEWSPQINGIKRIDHGRVPQLGIFALDMADLRTAVASAKIEVTR